MKKTPEQIRAEIRAKRLADSKMPFRYRYLWELLLSEQTNTAKLLGVAIWLHTDQEGKGAFPGQQTLAALTRVDLRSVRRATRQLQENGLLDVKSGSGKVSSRYAVAIPERTILELDAALREDSRVRRDGTPESGQGGLQSPPINADDQRIESTPNTSSVEEEGHYPSGEGLGFFLPAGSRKRGRQGGLAFFEFMPVEKPLEAIFWDADAAETSSITDAEIVETLRRATKDRIGKALLSIDGIETVRQMMAAMIAHAEYSAEEALDHVQGRIWERIGSHEGIWLNCFSLVFKRICAKLLSGDALTKVEELRQSFGFWDYAERLHPRLLSRPKMAELFEIFAEHGEEAMLAAIAQVLTCPGGSDRPRHHIETWSFFVPALKQNRRREQLRAAGIAPGDAFGLGAKIDF